MDKLLFRRILVAGLTALAIIYVVYLLLSANFNVIPTENAEQVTVTDKIYSNGYIIRDETYVKNTSGGVVSYNVDDGDEVKKGGSVASVFSSEEDAVARTKAASLEDSMKALTKLEQTRRSNTEGIETVNNDITTNIETFLYNINNANIGKLDSNINSIINSVNHYQSFTGKTSSFKPEIASLQSQINELKKSSGDALRTLKLRKRVILLLTATAMKTALIILKSVISHLTILKNMKKQVCLIIQSARLSAVLTGTLLAKLPLTRQQTLHCGATMLRWIFPTHHQIRYLPRFIKLFSTITQIKHL